MFTKKLIWELNESMLHDDQSIFNLVLYGVYSGGEYNTYN